MPAPKKLTVEMLDGSVKSITNVEFLKFFWVMFEKLPWEDQQKRSAEPSGFGGPVARKPGLLSTPPGKPRPALMNVMPKPKGSSIFDRAKKPEPDPVRWESTGKNSVRIFDAKVMRETAGALLLNIGGREVWFPKAMLWDGTTVEGQGDQGDIVTSVELAEDKGLINAGDCPF